MLPYQAGRNYRDPIACGRTNPKVPIRLDHIVLKAVVRDRRRRFETPEELMLALQRGAFRPIDCAARYTAAAARPDGGAKAGLGRVAAGEFFAGLLVLFLPKQ